MNRYTTIRQLGDGTYGSVILGRSLESGGTSCHKEVSIREPHLVHPNDHRFMHCQLEIHTLTLAAFFFFF